MKKKPAEITRLEDHIDAQYGIRGTEKREKFEQGFESFLLTLESVNDDNSMDVSQTHEL